MSVSRAHAGNPPKNKHKNWLVKVLDTISSEASMDHMEAY